MRMIGTGAPSKPYFAALIQCVCAAARVAKGNALVDFVFDRNDIFMPLVMKQYRLITDRAPDDFRRRLGKLSFSASSSAGALQAADLAAYYLYHQALGGYERKIDLAMTIRRLGDVCHESRGRFAMMNAALISRLLSHPDAKRALRTLRQTK